MSRTIRRVACTAALALVLGVAAIAVTHQEPAGARRAPVSASGTIHCTKYKSIKLHFDPALLNGGATPGVVRYKAFLTDCIGILGPRGIATPAPDGIAGGRVQGTMSLARNDCNAPGGGTGSATVHWTGSGRYVDTQVTYGSGELAVKEPFGSGFVSPADHDTTVSGSFAGQAAHIEMRFDPTSIQKAVTSCMPKIKGQPGTGGLKRLTPTDFGFSINNGVNFT